MKLACILLLHVGVQNQRSQGISEADACCIQAGQGKLMAESALGRPGQLIAKASSNAAIAPGSPRASSQALLDVRWFLRP